MSKYSKFFDLLAFAATKRLGFCQKFVLSDFSICVAYSQGESKGEMGHEDLFLSGDITQ